MAEIRVMREDLRPPASPPKRHFISIKDVTRDDVERLLATARTLERSMEREVKKLPTLKGRLVINVFYESSTRTSSSFELAAKRLSADTMSIKSSGSSVDKGESLKDTAITLGAYDPDVIVIGDAPKREVVVTLNQIYIGEHIHSPHVKVFRARSVIATPVEATEGAPEPERSGLKKSEETSRLRP